MDKILLQIRVADVYGDLRSKDFSPTGNALMSISSVVVSGDETTQ